MTDTSILITAKDNYSTALKKMQATTKTFGKDVDSMQSKLKTLNSTKYKLNVDLSKAKNELKALQKEMNSGKEVTAEFTKKYEKAQETVDNLSSHLKILSNEAAKTKKSMDQLSQSAGGGSGNKTGLTSVMQGLAQAGLFKQVGSSVTGLSGQLLTSYAGDNTASAISSILSGAVSGASIGSIGGIGIGTAIGAGVGALAGGIEALTEKLGRDDDRYRDYVSSQYDTWTQTRANSLAEGTGIAANREADRISFATLLGGEENASALLSDLESYAAKTPFAYDDLTAASKTLLSYGVGQGDILSYLGALGDAGSAVGLSGSDIASLATYLGRIKSNGTVTQEYMNPMQERGIDVYGMLAEDIGISIAELKDQISQGNVDGASAVATLIAAMQEQFGGSMEDMSSTYAGLTSTLEDTQAQLSAAEGEAYNEMRKSGQGGISDQIAWYDEHMERLKEGYSAMGEYQASLENTRDQAFLDAMDAALDSEEYKAAAAANDGAEMGKILAEAQATAQNEYLNSEAYQEYEQTQIDIVNKLQASSAVSGAWEMFGYHLGEEMSKGIAAGLVGAADSSSGVSDLPDKTNTGASTFKGLAEIWYSDPEMKALLEDTYGGLDPNEFAPHASGLNRVPYDGYPAILHEGERVLTANTVRQMDAMGAGVSVVIQNCTVRQDSDIEAIAEQLYDRLAAARRGMR